MQLLYTFNMDTPSELLAILLNYYLYDNSLYHPEWWYNKITLIFQAANWHYINAILASISKITYRCKYHKK